MKRLLERISAKHALIYRVLVLLIGIGIVVYLMPREIRFKYNFSESKPWQHEHLYADFSFSIEKEKTELESEKLEIESKAKQFYTKNDELVNQKIEAFNQVFDQLLEDEKGKQFLDFLSKRKRLSADQIKKLKALGQKELKAVYKKGIIPSNLVDKEHLWIRKASQAQVLHTEHYFTIEQAIQQLKNLNGLDSLERKTLRIPFQNQLESNIVFDEELTKKDLEQKIGSIQVSKGFIEQASLLVAKGQMVDEATFQKLKSYRKAFKKRNSNQTNHVLLVVGQVLITSLCFLILFVFILQFREDVFEDNRNITFIFFNVVLMFLMAKTCISFDPNLIYALPFCLLPLILKAFYDTRLALFAHLITVLLVGFLTSNDFDFVFIQFIGGIVSILTVNRMYRRADLLSSAFKIILVYALSYLSIEMLQNTSIQSIDLERLGYLAIGGLLTIMAYPLIYAFEKLFGLTSDISLLELSDTNSPLLKKLQDEVPGTFQHSLQVANLAESGVAAIGGNVLLARAGALYHDIGKMKNPQFFIENQHTSVNPHDDLDPETSAKLIIQHVINGIELAKRHNIPDRLIDFIRTHHGTSLVQYFYRQYINENPEEEASKNIENFRYPGPKPFSKETAVLMMADSVEAASKSLKEPDVTKINTLVDKIIESQMNEGQFDHADISLKQISLIKKIFKEKLRNIYHLRIEYPD